MDKVNFEEKYIVIKLDDIKKYSANIDDLESICRYINMRRRQDGKSINTYLVVNTNEPYIADVAQILYENGHYTPNGTIEVDITESRLAAAESRAEQAEAELKRYKEWVNDLQSGMYVNCVYCGHRYGLADKVPVSMAESLKQHIENCTEHPMSKLKAELATYKRALELACGYSINPEADMKMWLDCAQAEKEAADAR